jgi:hypothetical protein
MLFGGPLREQPEVTGRETLASLGNEVRGEEQRLIAGPMPAVRIAI